MPLVVYVLPDFKLLFTENNTLKDIKLVQDYLKTPLRIVVYIQDLKYLVQSLKTQIFGFLQVMTDFLGAEIVLVGLKPVHLDKKFNTPSLLLWDIRDLTQNLREPVLFQIQQAIYTVGKSFEIQHIC